jgi:peptide-methionine (S)-S-oxide reductase
MSDTTNPDAATGGLATATLGGGCFWCLEAVYEEVRGVERVVSGYAGGREPNPTYEQVCAGRTGHAEVVQLAYDPSEISYREILEIFFTIHDPTTPNRQGADVGPQYRSIVLAHDDEQAETARAVIAELAAEGVWQAPIVTQIVPLDRFWPAETYHQHYYARNPRQAYCQVVVEPKVAKFRQRFAERRRAAAR